MDISLAPRGAAEVQGHVVQGGGQLPGDRGVGQGRAAGKAGSWQAWPAHGFLLPDMLVVAAEGLLDVEQEDKQLGLLQMGLLVWTLEQWRGQQLRLVVM